MNYEQIRKANESIRTTDIKGKEYAEVNQRIKAFRMCYPTGSIITEMLSNENGICIIKATIGVEDPERGFVVLGNGTAYEKENSSFINKTSYIENCETSAVGRALGMAGFGIDTSVASYEEVANAISNQEQPEISKATPKQLEKIKKLVIDIPAMLKYYGITKIEDLNVMQASDIIAKKEGIHVY